MSPTRRRFLAAAPLAGAALAADTRDERPALLGGAKVHPEPFPSWPVLDQTEERAMLDTLRSGKWYRGNGTHVARFEEAYAQLTGAKKCLAVANGTSALYTSMQAMGIEPGDEVIVPPYTFVATINAVLRQYALPVFVDTDPETFQMDARKLEAAITPRTRAIVPVHLGGNVCDLDAMLAIAARHSVPVLEDACQAHLAEWRGRKAGTFGKAGCFSFQASKNLNSGEGGAILTSDEDLHERCFAFHNNGSGTRPVGGFTYKATGCNLRMTEFQAALLMAQMSRIEAQAKTRTENGAYLTSMLKEIPGVAPARMYDGCTRNAYHLYMLRYDKREFAGLSRAVFLKALAAEGIPASGGYTPLNTQPFLKSALGSRGYARIFSATEMAAWEERNRCPANDRLCDEAVWFVQTMLLAPRTSMEQIAGAIRKIRKHAGELAGA
ncbi:MAG TPA: DegT/DnrJ/EryC1/StrS family aminotransferase [Candidatus Acidoferrales bacterium]|nr:DegT/DnrJ/EryC1/StrS family aminotransferase [Candidatus Acidoferrales bacterium]